MFLKVCSIKLALDAEFNKKHCALLLSVYGVRISVFITCLLALLDMYRHTVMIIHFSKQKYLILILNQIAFDKVSYYTKHCTRISFGSVFFFANSSTSLIAIPICIGGGVKKQKIFLFTSYIYLWKETDSAAIIKKAKVCNFLKRCFIENNLML